MTKVSDCNVVLTCERVRYGDYEDQLVFEEGFLLHASVGKPGADESDVTLGGADHVGDVAGVSDFHGGFYGGMEGNEVGEETGKNVFAGDGACADDQTATDLASEVFEFLGEV